MLLQTCTEESCIDEQLSEYRVRRVAARKIYYCVEGRNAWWATRVTRYFNGSMHITFDDATSFLEGMRTQGSIFYIVEIPALIVESECFCLVVTQINCDSPLEAYSANAVGQKIIQFRKKVGGARDNYLQRGAPMDGVYLSFENDSRFWRSHPPPNDSVVRLISPCSLEHFEDLPRSHLVTYKSRSRGSQYPLEWNGEKSAIKSDAIRSLATHV